MTKEEFINKYKVLTGYELYKYLLNYKKYKYRRKIINDIESILNTNKIEHKLIAITGDRRRGKTTTLNQIICSINDYENSCLIQCEDKTNLNNMTYELFNLILYNKFNPKYIFIDEITESKELKYGLKYLSDNIKSNENNIIVTGTWSQIFHYYKYNVLFDRVNIFELDPITIFDNTKIRNSGIKDFIKNGGYIQDIYSDISFEDYLDNLNNYLILYGNEYNINKDTIKAVSFNLLKDGLIKKNNKLNSYKINSKKFIDKISIENLNNIKIDKNVTKIITDALELTKQVIPRYNYMKEINLDRIEKDIVYKNVLIKSYIAEKLNYNEKFMRDIALEDYIYFKLEKDGDLVKLRHNENEEIDIVDLRREMLIEVKNTKEFDVSFLKHLKNEELLKHYEIEKFSKNIVYLGDTFNKDNVKAWNIYDFMNEFTDKYLLEEVTYNKNNKIIIDNNLLWS